MTDCNLSTPVFLWLVNEFYTAYQQTVADSLGERYTADVNVWLYMRAWLDALDLERDILADRDGVA